MMIKKVSIVQRVLTHYRVEFYNRLKSLLEKDKIELQLIYGQGSKAEESRRDQADIGWAIRIHNRYLPGGIVFQPCHDFIKDSDLVIVEQANKFPLNFILLAKRLYSKQKVAFWGHGLDWMVAPDAFPNRFKWLYSDKVDWWFAYTEGVKEVVVSRGFHEKKITVVQNSIDTGELIKLKNSIDQEELNELKRQLGLNNAPVGVFCGGMYNEKKVPFLVDACLRIKEQIKDFQMVFIGGGPEAVHVKNAASSHNWIHYMGPLFGQEKVKHILLGDICLNPGAVGLAILDMFALQVPMMTTYSEILSPEIAYLENGKNGIITEKSIDIYAREAVGLLQDMNRLATLKQGCEESAKRYTIENMAINFANGIKDCLDN